MSAKNRGRISLLGAVVLRELQEQGRYGHALARFEPDIHPPPQKKSVTAEVDHFRWESADQMTWVIRQPHVTPTKVDGQRQRTSLPSGKAMVDPWLTSIWPENTP